MTLSTYQGSRLLLFVSEGAGLPIDQFNFLFSQLVAIVSGLIFRAYLKPCPQNTLRRHLVCTLLGILLGHFCFGPQMWHLYCQIFVSYLALLVVPRHLVQYVIFVFAMGYLAGIHIYRQIYDYGGYTLDISSPLMITTQKLTYLAFAYYDGMREDKDLNEDQKAQRIKVRPHIIEFLSYIFNFQGIIVGPLCYYQDYIDFIDGNSILKAKNRNPKESEDSVSTIIKQPSIVWNLLKKCAIFAVCGIVFFQSVNKFTVKATLTPEMLEKPIWERVFWFFICVGAQRSKYYIAWVLADIVNNASGFGFNGYDKDGNAKWDLVTNVHIWTLETSTSVKMSFDAWNIQTQLWLRRIAYERLPYQKTLGVFMMSAFWHGFYPSYYMAFGLCALLVQCGRSIRRKIRPYFIHNKILSIFYSCINWFCAMFALNYMAASFDLLEFWKDIELYNKWYWCVHVFCIVAPIICKFIPTHPSVKKQEEEKRKKKAAVEVVNKSE